MITNTEKGIANYLANFTTLISRCNAIEAKYVPNNSLLEIENLNLVEKNAANALLNFKVAKSAWQVAVWERKQIMLPLKKLCTKLMNAFAASGAAKFAVANARAENKKIQGTRAVPIKGKKPLDPSKKTEGDSEQLAQPNDKLAKHISASQQGNDQTMDHFDQLINILIANPIYAPNETELTIASLQGLLANMRAANQNVTDCSSELINSQFARDNIFYTPFTGLIPIAVSVKQYFLSIYGSRTEEGKKINALRFS